MPVKEPLKFFLRLREGSSPVRVVLSNCGISVQFVKTLKVIVLKMPQLKTFGGQNIA